MDKKYVFISESVPEGHPDKVCDKISDAVLDQYLFQDPFSHIRVECAVSSAILFIAARFASEAKVDFSRIARKIIKQIGYDQEDFNEKNCSVLTAPKALPLLKRWRFDERKLTEEELERIVPKTQVTVFGYACDHTDERIPLPILLAHKLAKKLDDARTKKIIPYLMPDGKVQVGIEFQQRQPVRIHTITITASQKDSVWPSDEERSRDISEKVIAPVFEKELIKPDESTKIFVNPDGAFLGGPIHHSGLTGRKNGIDTYGEYCRHSGKALSGKDPMRIDRVGAYAARYAAKNVVEAGLASECEVTLSWTIGITRPISLEIHTFGTGRLSDHEIRDIVEANFDFRLAAIMKKFDLRHLPAKNSGKFYQNLSAYGHFGRLDLNLPWEETDKAHLIR